MGAWCCDCDKEFKGDGTVCNVCGSSFLSGSLDKFAILKDTWVSKPVIWWNPSTWEGGYWKNVGGK